MSANTFNIPKFIKISADVRYWEDATLNGCEDEQGEMPLRNGNSWEPVINLETGSIDCWPAGVTADVHYKVCDAGEYWLLDENKKPFAKWSGYYVPDDILCVGCNGYGDYIIFKVGSDGFIIGWQRPLLEPHEWELI